MMWLWVVFAFVGGVIGGIAFGRRARMVAYYAGTLDGYKDGLKDGWDDASNVEEYEPPPVPRDVEIGEGYKAFLNSQYGKGSIYYGGSYPREATPVDYVSAYPNYSETDDATEETTRKGMDG